MVTRQTGPKFSKNNSNCALGGKRETDGEFRSLRLAARLGYTALYAKTRRRSAVFGDRPALQGLLDDVPGGKIDVIAWTSTGW
jgi:hypothetical protein